MNKVFGIGLSRTGTTSLARALEILGYRTVHCPRDIVEIAGWCDACSDITVSMRYKILDVVFPGSKFVYTIRNIEHWLDSCERHFNDKERLDRPRHDYSEATAIYAAYTEAEIKTYGQLDFDREVWRATYNKHDEDVKSYFSGRSQDLLEIDISKTKKWDQLLSFLGISEVPFPHLNKGIPC